MQTAQTQIKKNDQSKGGTERSEGTKLTAKPKIVQSIDLLELSQIERVSATSVVLYWNRQTWILLESKEVMTLLEKVMGQRSILMKTAVPRVLHLRGFEAPGSERVKEGHNVSDKYRQICAALKRPVDMGTVVAFDQFEESGRRIMKFSRDMQPDVNSEVIASPLYDEDKLRVLIFEGYAPGIAGRIIRLILEKNHNVTTLVLSKYQDFQFELMNLADLDNPSVVSITLHELKMKDLRACFFITELGKYRGRLQQFSLRKMKVGQELMRTLDQVAVTSRCFSTIESLSFSDLDVSQQDSMVVFSYALAMGVRLPVLMKFELVKWSCQLCLRPDPKVAIHFMKTQSLRSMKFVKTDLRDILRDIVFPPLLSELVFDSCRFSPESALNVLKEISKGNIPLTLSMASMVLPVDQRERFYSMLRGMDPIVRLRELNWTGNPIPVGHILTFCGVFCHSDICFLGMNDCFKGDYVSGLVGFLDYLVQNTNIWGLEIGVHPGKMRGVESTEMFNQVLERLARIPSLSHLDISGHMCSGVNAWEDLVAFLRKSHIRELNIGSTGTGSLGNFYEMYHEICQLEPPRLIERPTADLSRFLIQNGEFMLQKPQFLAFRSDMLKSCIPSKSSIRASFWELKKDSSEFFDYAARFPLSGQSLLFQDGYNIRKYSEESFEIRTLYDEGLRVSDCDDFAAFQMRFIPSPYDEPGLGSEKMEFIVPERISSSEGYLNETEMISVVADNVSTDDLSMYSKMLSPDYNKVFVSISTIMNRFGQTLLQPEVISCDVAVREPVDYINPGAFNALMKYQLEKEWDKVTETSETESALMNIGIFQKKLLIPSVCSESSDSESEDIESLIPEIEPEREELPVEYCCRYIGVVPKRGVEEEETELVTSVEQESNWDRFVSSFEPSSKQSDYLSQCPELPYLLENIDDTNNKDSLERLSRSVELLKNRHPVNLLAVEELPDQYESVPAEDHSSESFLGSLVTKCDIYEREPTFNLLTFREKQAYSRRKLRYDTGISPKLRRSNSEDLSRFKDKFENYEPVQEDSDESLPEPAWFSALPLILYDPDAMLRMAPEEEDLSEIDFDALPGTPDTEELVFTLIARSDIPLINDVWY